MGQIGPYVGNGLYWVWKESCFTRNSGQYHPQKGLTCNYDKVSKNQTLVVIDNSRPPGIHWIIAIFLLSNMTIWSHIVLHNRLDLLEFDNIFAFNPAFGGCRATLCLYLLQQFWRAAAKVFLLKLTLYAFGQGNFRTLFCDRSCVKMQFCPHLVLLLYCQYLLFYHIYWLGHDISCCLFHWSLSDFC